MVKLAETSTNIWSTHRHRESLYADRPSVLFPSKTFPLSFFSPLICEVLWVSPIPIHDACWWCWRGPSASRGRNCCSAAFLCLFCSLLRWLFIVQQPANCLFFPLWSTFFSFIVSMARILAHSWTEGFWCNKIMRKKSCKVGGSLFRSLLFCIENMENHHRKICLRWKEENLAICVSLGAFENDWKMCISNNN